MLTPSHRICPPTRVYNTEGYTDGTIIADETNYRYGIRYNYFRRDHLGNNREVWFANTDTTIQRTQYYPSGLPWAESTGQEVQNKKYNGKEWIEMHGLDEYDSQARMYYPAIMRTTTLDPLAEKYYSMSPYAWCGNNPINLIDPDGRKLKPAQVFLSSPYGAVYNKLLTNKAYLRIVDKYVNSTVYNIGYDIKDKSTIDPKRAAATGTNSTKRLTTINGKTTSQYIKFDSQQDYFKVGLTQEGMVPTEIGMAHTIIHEGLHSYLFVKGVTEIGEHNTYMKYSSMMLDALKEYNTINSMGFTDAQLTDLTYSGLPSNNSQFQSYIQGFADKNGTSYEAELGAYNQRISDMVWTKKTEE